MKIKKTSFFLWIILFFLLLPTWIFFLSNLAFWPWDNYIFSNNMNVYLEKIFPKNEKIQLKRWDYYYRLWEYEKALQKYVKINCKTQEICFSLSYNLGNTYYKLWEKSLSPNEKISFWQKALSSYQKALEVKEDDHARKNYEFVLKKLNELMDEIQQNIQSNQNQNQPNETQKSDPQENNSQQEESDKTQEEQEQQENSQESGEQEQPQNQTDETQPRGPSIKIDENAIDETTKLTPDQKEAIEKYIENLQQEEKNNIHLNKPREQRDIYDILREDFMFEDLNKNQSGW